MPANRIATALGLFLGLTGACLACADDPDAQRMVPQSGGGPEVYAVLDPLVISQPTGLKLTVCDAEAAEIAVDAWMPAHQHGMNYAPDVRNLGGRRYAVSNMVYHMPGLWELKVTVRSAADKTVYVLDMPVR